MIKKAQIIVCLLISGLLISLFHLESVHASNNDVLGATEEQWQTNLRVIGGEYEFSDTFIDEIKSSQSKLENKYGAEHFEKLNSKQDSFKKKQRENSLLHRKQQPPRSSFIIDLNLNKLNYNKLIQYIPILGTYYGEHHIAQILPYIAYCLNYEVKNTELDFYLNEFIKRQTPPDIVCERLYRLAEGTI